MRKERGFEMERKKERERSLVNFTCPGFYRKTIGGSDLEMDTDIPVAREREMESAFRLKKGRKGI